ncbi:putative O-methylsterigmatocystin oxidoreductase [Acephala macrosclerotiorum]|nr:putative O-methylsterigmatocystin oxidoreductase [Acephala macrosclerotiorum]
MWVKFKEWADMYGPIYKTKMLGTTFLVVSDEKIAEELLVKRAKTYSDRPAIRSLFDSKSTHGSMEYLPLMGKNKYWARQRRFTHAYLTQASNNQYYGVMTFEIKRWLFKLCESPDDFSFSLEDMASKIMCQLTWDDTSFSAMYKESAWGLLTQMSPAGPITNVRTPLWHLPLWANPWKRAERIRHDEQQALWMEKFLGYLASEKTSNLSGDYEASSVIGMMALVGIFTVAGPLHYFLIAMVFHQDWLAKCQEEVDKVCEGRMPTLFDSPNLPVLRACILETMRWKPNVPTGVTHGVKADDSTAVAFMRNPDKYPDPDNHHPERYLQPGWPTFREPPTVYPTVKGLSSFGYGQRQCLGQTLTQDELLLGCGALCWGFNMKKKVDPRTSLEVDIDLNASNSLLIVKPDKFQMQFTPRSQARKKQMIDQWKVAEQADIEARYAFQKRAEEARAG